MTVATDDFAAGVQAFTESIRAAINDPADQIVLLCSLATFDTQPIAGTSSVAVAKEAMRASITSLARRSTLASIALACAAYQPTSADDAQSVLDSVAAIFDVEIVAAADAGEDDAYLAIRRLKASVVLDLQSRGAQLPDLIAVTLAGPTSTLELAYRLYADASRADDIAARSGCQHPGFLPTSMTLLSS